MDIRENILLNSHANLNKVGAALMKQKCHQRYYKKILVSDYLSFNRQERLVINEDGSQSMKQKLYWQLLSIFKSGYLKYSKSLESERKFELSISNKIWQHVFRYRESDHIFSHFLGTYLVYILFLLVCSKYLITLKNGRWRNLLSIDSRLNQIEPSTNNISPPNEERGYRTKFEILLEGLFQYITE